MSKYDTAKVLRLTKARLPTVCCKCGAQIKRAEQYYREALELMAKPPGLELKAFCKSCVESGGGI